MFSSQKKLKRRIIMKKRIKLIAVFLVVTVIIVFGCKNNSNPAAASTATPADHFTSTVTATITPTFTSTITPDAGSKSYTFDSTDDSWNTVGGSVTCTARNTTGSYVLSGAGSLAVGCSFTSSPSFYIGFIGKYFLSNPIDLRGKTITFHVYVPSDLAAISPPYDVQLGFVDGIGNAWVRQNGPTLATAGWNTVQFTCPATANYSYANLITLTIEKGSGYSSANWAGNIYIDDISW
jgi:hypothetical protein